MQAGLPHRPQKKGFHSMKPKDQIVKPGNSEDAQTGLDQFAAQTDLVNSRLAGAWQCWDGCAHPDLACWLSPSPGTSSAPFSNTSRSPRFLGNIAAPKGCAVLLGVRHRQPLEHLWQWITALSVGANLWQVEIVQTLNRLPGITPTHYLSPSPPIPPCSDIINENCRDKRGASLR